MRRSLMPDEPRQKQPTQFEKFLAFTKKVVSVPKVEIDRREKEYQKARKQRRKRAL
jgi:hypothetical protein